MRSGRREASDGRGGEGEPPPAGQADGEVDRPWEDLWVAHSWVLTLSLSLDLSVCVSTALFLSLD